MEPAIEERLNVPREEVEKRRRQPPLPDTHRPIERHIPTAFDRCYDDGRGHHWIYISPKKSNLTARVYPELNGVEGAIIHLHVFEQSQVNSENEERGTSVLKWSVSIRLEEPLWQKQLAGYTGVIMKQADNQPRCWHCKHILILRARESDGAQFFGCSSFPRCRGTATILDYGIRMDGFSSNNGNGSRVKVASPAHSP